MTRDGSVRRLLPDDFAIFRQLRLEALRLEPGAFASTLADWQSLPDEEWRARLASNAVVAAFRGSEPVGLMGLVRQGASKMKHRAALEMVYLREGERGSGLATAMLDALREHAGRDGIRQIELAVSAQNPAALRFYLRNGFREIGRIPGAFLHDGREIDEVTMAARVT